MASEREFTNAQDIANGSRTRLLPQNVRKLLILKHNLKGIGYNSIKLPDFKSAIELEDIDLAIGGQHSTSVHDSESDIDSFINSD